MKQTTFAGLAYNAKKKRTRREQFLIEMEAVMPWVRLLALVKPQYPVAGQDRWPLGCERMLRIYFMQQWFNLSDTGAEDALYDSESMRRFAGLELGEDAIPDESSMLGFRHLLERHALTERLFGEVRALLKECRLPLKAGTIVDYATIINAPSST
ncbi:MAG: transposase [Gammaproteobacteria bacterium]|nr:transposase [Gammaproteobacteria bacterium]